MTRPHSLLIQYVRRPARPSHCASLSVVNLFLNTGRPSASCHLAPNQDLNQPFSSRMLARHNPANAKLRTDRLRS